MTSKLYHYNAYVTSVYDADTITVDIDLGFGVTLKKQKIRLVNINALEIRSKDPDERQRAVQARDYVRAMILDKQILLHTLRDKKGKYGRYLATVYTWGGECINKLLVEKGMAEWYMIG